MMLYGLMLDLECLNLPRRSKFIGNVWGPRRHCWETSAQVLQLILGLKVVNHFLIAKYVLSRRLMGSTDQADPSCIYFRISWILMERPWFYFFVPSTCCRASEASKIDYFKNKVWTFWTKNFNSSLKNGYFGAIIFQEIEFFGPKCLYLIFEVVNFWGFWGPATSGGDKKNKTKVVPSIFMEFWSRNNLDQLGRLTP